MQLTTLLVIKSRKTFPRHIHQCLVMRNIIFFNITLCPGNSIPLKMDLGNKVNAIELRFICTYFVPSGVWHGKGKPYQRPQTPNNNTCSTDTRGTQGVSDRYVPAQHLTYTADDGTVTFNRRKYDQVGAAFYLNNPLWAA